MTIPYMQLYVSDYLADTAHLTTEEHGAYLLLIMNYWQRGKALDNTNERLANVARLSNECWQIVKIALNEYFEIEGDLWHHKRIDAELDKVREKSDKARASGQASVKKRKLNGRSTNAERKANYTDTDTDTDKKEDTDTVSNISDNKYSLVGAASPPPKPEIKKSEKGSRLPEDWTLPIEWGQWALTIGMTRNEILTEEDNFRDYWSARTGSGATKRNWEATWRIWCRKTLEYKTEKARKNV